MYAAIAMHCHVLALNDAAYAAADLGSATGNVSLLYAKRGA